MLQILMSILSIFQNIYRIVLSVEFMCIDFCKFRTFGLKKMAILTEGWPNKAVDNL